MASSGLVCDFRLTCGGHHVGPVGCCCYGDDIVCGWLGMPCSICWFAAGKGELSDCGRWWLLVGWPYLGEWQWSGQDLSFGRFSVCIMGILKLLVLSDNYSGICLRRRNQRSNHRWNQTTMKRSHIVEMDEYLPVGRQSMKYSEMQFPTLVMIYLSLLTWLNDMISLWLKLVGVHTIAGELRTIRRVCSKGEGEIEISRAMLIFDWKSLKLRQSSSILDEFDLCRLMRLFSNTDTDHGCFFSMSTRWKYDEV